MTPVKVGVCVEEVVVSGLFVIVEITGALLDIETESPLDEISGGLLDEVTGALLDKVIDSLLDEVIGWMVTEVRIGQLVTSGGH